MSDFITLKPNTNTGVRLGTQPTDYIAGVESGLVYKVNVEAGDWILDITDDEWQSGLYFDTMACVTFSLLNTVEMQINRFIRLGLLRPETLAKLKELGFIDEHGHFNASDRFTAYMSGTTENGNYLYKVADSVKNDGLLPENDWGYPREQRTPVFSREDYYMDPGQARKDKAKIIKELFNFQWEWVISDGRAMSEDVRNLMKYHLKQAPLQIAAPVCPTWNTGDVKACDLKNAGHATAIYNLPDYFADYDHYSPFKKKLAKDYYIPYVLKMVVTEKPATIVIPPPAPAFSHNFTTQIKYGAKNDSEVKALQKALKLNGCFPSSVAETGNYGEITRLAVDKFYKKYKLANWLTLYFINGRWVGPAMRAKLNELYNK